MPEVQRSPFDIPDDVLRCMANLNSTNEANWATIKQWLSVSLVHYENAAALGIHLPESEIRRYQGVSVFLFNLTSWAENAKEELERRERETATREEKPINVP